MKKKEKEVRPEAELSMEPLVSIFRGIRKRTPVLRESGSFDAATARIMVKDMKCIYFLLIYFTTESGVMWKKIITNMS